MLSTAPGLEAEPAWKRSRGWGGDAISAVGDASKSGEGAAAIAAAPKPGALAEPATLAGRRRVGAVVGMRLTA